MTAVAKRLTASGAVTSELLSGRMAFRRTHESVQDHGPDGPGRALAAAATVAVNSLPCARKPGDRKTMAKAAQNGHEGDSAFLGQEGEEKASGCRYQPGKDLCLPQPPGDAVDRGDDEQEAEDLVEPLDICRNLRMDGVGNEQQGYYPRAERSSRL